MRLLGLNKYRLFTAHGMSSVRTPVCTWGAPRPHLIVQCDLLASYNLPAPSIKFPPFFHRCSLAIPWSTCPLVGALVHLFSKGTLCGWLERLFFHRFHSLSLPFVFHKSGIWPPPFFSLLLTTMPHGGRSVMTSLDCVGTPAVAVLCESDCPSSACVVQPERKKKKRVSVIVGNRKVPKKSANVGSVSTMIVERLMDGVLSDVEATFLAPQIHADTGSLCFESTTPRDANALAWLMDQGASQADIADQASKTAYLYLRSASNGHRSPSSTKQLLFDDHKSPSNDHQSPSNERLPPNHPCDHSQSTSNFHQLPSNK
jgi:hypothetical protein